MLERNDLNYQPMTDMTQCASELNQIKSFIFKTIVEYISTCTLSYMFCMFFRCGFWTGPFFRPFFGLFFGPFFWTILQGGSTPLVLREGWDAVYQYSGRGGRQSVITQGGVREGLLLGRERCNRRVSMNHLSVASCFPFCM